MLLGLITPSAGEVRVFGKSLAAARESVLAQMNFTAPYVAYPWRLTVRENLRVFAALYEIRDPRARIDELLRMFELEHLRGQADREALLGRNHARGTLQGLDERPRLLLLDEPTVYLDPQVAALVKRCARGCSARPEPRSSTPRTTWPRSRQHVSGSSF